MISPSDPVHQKDDLYDRSSKSFHPEAEFDQNKAQAFAGRMLSALNDAALVLMTSIGHRTGLFGHLSKMSPCTVEQLASAAGLSARYVREWLAVMTTSGIVKYRPQTRAYALPPEHAAFLTYGGPVNIAVNAQFLGVTAGVEDKIVECFQTGGGIHYHHYGRFHDVMAEASHQSIGTITHLHRARASAHRPSSFGNLAPRLPGCSMNWKCMVSSASP